MFNWKLSLKTAIMEFTDAQVLAHLKMRKARLSIELKRVETAIMAFERVTEIEPLDLYPYTVDEVKNDFEDDDELAMATLLYNPREPFEKKVLFALSKLGKADAEQITQLIIKVDGKIKDVKALYERIRWQACRMASLDVIERVKNGKTNLYMLKN